jgi:hypothetical protein
MENDMSYTPDNGFVLSGNTTSTPLNAGATFTGAAVDVSAQSSITVAAKTDQAGTMIVEFSIDGTNWDSALTYLVAANTNDVHRVVITRKYFRIKFTNTSASNQTFLRLQCISGQQSSLTSPLNSQIQTDADTLAVRPLDFNLMVSEGLYQNHSTVTKDGINFDIDSASVPEDITNEGGVYAGFPTGAVEAGEVVVAGADTGTVYYFYLASSASTDYAFGSVSVTGAGTYALGHNVWRCNFAYFVSSSATAFNAGDITIRNTPTTANVFCVIPAGYSQSFCAAYTVPAGSTVYIDRFTGNMRGSTSGSMDGFFWYRPQGQSPRYRFPFELQFGTLYCDDIDYLLAIPSGVDIIPRILSASANNLVAKFNYRIIKVAP